MHFVTLGSKVTLFLPGQDLLISFKFGSIVCTMGIPEYMVKIIFWAVHGLGPSVTIFKVKIEKFQIKCY